MCFQRYYFYSRSDNQLHSLNKTVREKLKRGDFDWNWDEKCTFSLNDEIEFFSEDKLSRRKYAEYLYFYLENKGQISNTVINLNAEWGAGKSFFIKRFYNSIKDIHPCVYIDAWKQDFSDDAFLTLFSSLSQQLQSYAGDLDANLINCGEAIGRFTKGVIPAVLSGLVKNYAGIDSVGDIAKEASQLMLKEHQEKLKGIHTLKEELAQWSRLAFENEFSAPIFIFIDELDRCRPDYAISLLEIVKHIFDIPNFVFIISTDTDQLQHSIKNIYGSNFSANDYLGRFFHRRFTLKAPELHILISDVINNSIADNYTELTSEIYPLTSTPEDFSRNISSIFEAFDLNLRDSIRNTERLIDILKSKIIKKKLDYIFLMALIIIYDKDRQIIDSQIGRRSVTHNFTELLKNSNNLKGAPQSQLFLKLETNQNKLGVDYVYRSLNSRTRITEFNSEISIPLLRYLEVALHFVKNADRYKESRETRAENSLMLIQHFPPSTDIMIKYLQGVIIETEPEARFHSLINYVELIELASSFE